MTTRTNALTLIAAMLRATALLILSSLIIALPATYPSLVDWGAFSGDRHAILVIGISVLSSVVVPALLWLFATPIARISVGKHGEEVFDTGLDGAGIEAVVISGFGLWCLLEYGMWMLRLLLQRFISRDDWPALAQMQFTTYGVDLSVAVIGTVVGVLLLLRASGIAGALRRLRAWRPGQSGA
jgi:hypothetical protein